MWRREEEVVKKGKVEVEAMLEMEIWMNGTLEEQRLRV